MCDCILVGGPATHQNSGCTEIARDNDSTSLAQTPPCARLKTHRKSPNLDDGPSRTSQRRTSSWSTTIWPRAGPQSRPSSAARRRVTYAQLHEAVNRFGNVLLELGVRMEERIAILLPDSPEWAYVFFGAIKIGAVAIPLNTLLASKDYEYLLNDCRARVLVVHASLLDRIAAHSRPAAAPGAGHRGGRQGRRGPRPSRRSWSGPRRRSSRPTRSKDDMAFWLYSSGTTGFPKGAIHLHHDMLVAADRYARETIGLAESRRLVLGGQAVLRLRAGQRSVFPLANRRHDGALARSAPAREGLRDHRPLSAHGLLQRADQLRGLAARGGEDRAGPAWAGCGCAFRPARPCRGTCSSAGASGSAWRSSTASAPRKSCTSSSPTGRAGPEPGSTGQIVPGFEARIVDDDGRDLPPGEVGTLLIKGDSIAAGYWNKHEATKQTFRGEWINTYDKFMLDHDGYFWYSGRANDMLKVSGQAVWPAEVEAVLQEHPAVLESGVTGAANDEGLAQARGLRGAQGRPRTLAGAGLRTAGIRQDERRAAQVSAGRGLRRSVAQDGLGQDQALRAAAPRGPGRAATHAAKR